MKTSTRALAGAATMVGLLALAAPANAIPTSDGGIVQGGKVEYCLDLDLHYDQCGALWAIGFSVDVGSQTVKGCMDSIQAIAGGSPSDFCKKW